MFILINILMCTCGIIMCLSSSPVQSVIFLILSFCCAAILLFMFHVEFIGLLFIIIYVGAIAVLFLFVIMMLNVKNNQVDEIKTKVFSITNIVVLVCVGLYPFLLKTLYLFAFSTNNISLNFNYEALAFIIDKVSNIEVIGQILFNNYLVCVLLAGMVLLIALVGSIVLTLKFNKTEKKQIANRQLARNENFITFFK